MPKGNKQNNTHKDKNLQATKIRSERDRPKLEF